MLPSWFSSHKSWYVNCFLNNPQLRWDKETGPQTLLWYDTDSIENDVSCTIACIRYHGNVSTEPLPSNEVRGYAYRHTQWWGRFMKYAVEMGSSNMMYIPKLINIGSCFRKLTGVGYADSQAVRGLASGQSMWGLWWTKRHWGRISPSTSVSPSNHHSTNLSIIIISRGWHNRPIGGSSPSEPNWTPPPTISIKHKLKFYMDTHTVRRSHESTFIFRK
jgi:hypothetical protein